VEQRRLGRTDFRVSVLGFGCGAVGGLMVRGDAADQERAVARALDAGITYFDTAADYGQGASERNLGRVLRTLKADPVVGTKVRILPEQRGAIAATIAAAMEASLARLGRDHVQLYQLHNPIAFDGPPTTLTPAMVANEVLPAFERLRDQGKAQQFGFTGIGDADALRQVMAMPGMATVQLPYNLLNAGRQASLLADCATHDVGVIGIRTLAGGALSGSAARGALGVAVVEPIASGADYAADVAAALRLSPLVEAGHAADLVEAALRFAITSTLMGTAMVGLGSLAELDHAIAAVGKGALPGDAMALLEGLRD
jgi:L-galactose dehydrogenase/L-glyceraldehyde 3-phosphate reductase